MEQEFDAIVVGAGPAGSACAYTLARAGLEVLVVERGKFPGAKNMWGGAFFGPALRDLLPEDWKEAPLERWVTRHRFSLLAGEQALTVEYANPAFGRPPVNGFTLLRAKFDRWLAAKAEEAGAVVAAGLKADDLLWDGDRVAGIHAGGDALPANVVVACDGVNSLLAQKAGLRGELSAHQVKQGIKEVIALPRELIEERFGVTGEEGIAWEFLGTWTRGVPGGAFIYTNQESLSVGIVVQLSALVEKRIKANDLLEEFKAHPLVSGLLRGGRLVEYSAHLVPTGGLRMMPVLYRDGFLVAGDAAALVLSTGLILEGANFALASGIAAAQTIIKAREKGDFSRQTFAAYQELLEQNFVLRDLKTFRRAPDFLENPRLYGLYPELACGLAEKIFTNDGRPRQNTYRLVKETLRGKTSLWQLVRDFRQGKSAL